MALPRSQYIQEGQEGVYHCFTRCVRRAFLCGFDPQTGRDFSHRKSWLVDRLRFLAAIFAIDVCAFAVMDTHCHNILRLRPDTVARWSDLEVATRWLTLFPRRRNRKQPPAPPTDEDIRALADQPGRIATLRKRLCSLSWFMGRLNEFIARAANKEDKVKGRFWESRFKCQALLDEAAIAACMVYVDLNPIRAGLAATPEDSDFTSIQERIRAWKIERMAAGSVPDGTAAQATPPVFDGISSTVTADNNDMPDASPERFPVPGRVLDGWLCPIQSLPGCRGILSMTAAEYFDLVDRSGRMTRPDKRGAIDADLAPLLLRIGVNPKVWGETVTRFGSGFRLAAGMVVNLRNFADRLGRRWVQGLAMAKAAFATPQLRMQ